MTPTASEKIFEYQSGFGNEFATEAIKGALPEGMNSPQKPAFGLYAEQFSGTSFTTPRVFNKRSWFYRIRPSVLHRPFRQIDNGLWRSAPFNEVPVSPNQLRWNALEFPQEEKDFIDGLITIAGCGDGSMSGIAIHLYVCNKSMTNRFFYNSDGEMLIVPEEGRLGILTEMGALQVGAGEIAVIPRGLKISIQLGDEKARGYVCENYGASLRLPDLGPIGSNGLANPRDFEAPQAWFEEREGDFELVTKFGGNLWSCEIGHSPLDVVAWHGNNAPYRYDLRRFNTIGSISFDHPDPSIFTVLTSPTDSVGVANLDFVIFPDRWMVAEKTFRPPWYHRNIMSEYMGLVYGQYDAKEEGFVKGGGSLHNSFSAHGPDAEGFEKATNAELQPHKQENTLAFMFETRHLLCPTKFAMETTALQKNYYQCWQDLKKNFKM